MRLFKDSYKAIEAIKNKNLCKEDYDIALKYIYQNSMNSYEAIILKLYRNKHEFDELFETAVMSSYKCVDLYKNCYDILSDSQLSRVWRVMLNNPIECVNMLSHNENLNQDRRYQLLDSIILDFRALKFLFDKNNCSDKEILYVLKKIKNYKDFIFEFLMSESCNNDNEESYEYAINIILLDSDYSYKIINEKKHSSNKKLVYKVYQLHGEKYYEQFKRKFYDYFDFCIIFGFCLNDNHQKLLVKKLMNKKYKYYIEYITNLVDLNKENMDLVNSYLLIDSLK